MTLKYDSEILIDLMKRDGDDTPSDVLPYESGETIKPTFSGEIPVEAITQNLASFIEE